MLLSPALLYAAGLRKDTWRTTLDLAPRCSCSGRTTNVNTSTPPSASRYRPVGHVGGTLKDVVADQPNPSHGLIAGLGCVRTLAVMDWDTALAGMPMRSTNRVRGPGESSLR